MSDSNTAQILLIEDDSEIVAFIETELQCEGYKVEIARDGQQGLIAARQNPPDLIVLDRMLPGLDGLALCRRLRQSSDVPILMLTARSEVKDRVEGLDAGANDYLVKPFAFAELLARIEVMAKRTARSSAGGGNETALEAGDLTLNLLSRKVTRGDQTIELQSTEFRLLEYLLQHKGQVVTRTMLLEHVWDYHFDPQTNVIDVHISRLRAKIDKGFDTPMIKTIRGAGYIIDG